MTRMLICLPLYHVIMGSYTLIVGVLKYFLFWGVLSTLSFILWGFCPMALLSIFAFLCLKNLIAWRECWLSTTVSCVHRIVHLDCWSIKILSLLEGFVRLEFYAFVLLSYGAFANFLLFSVRKTWSHDENVDLSTPVSCDHGIVHLDCWSIKIFSLFGVFFPPWVLSFDVFVLWRFCPFLLFSVRPTWSHDENVDCPPVYHVIMGSYTLIVTVLKYFLFLGAFVRFEFYPLLFLSYGAFVHFCFSLSAHVIVWRECWLSTTVSYENGIVHLDCWSIKIFSLFGGFVRFEFY